MSTISRDRVHRAVERLPDERLAAAADLLEALAAHDRRVSAWREGLTAVEESDIAESLRREYSADQWIGDSQIEEWIESSGPGDNPSQPQAG